MQARFTASDTADALPAWPVSATAATPSASEADFTKDVDEMLKFRGMAVSIGWCMTQTYAAKSGDAVPKGTGRHMSCGQPEWLARSLFRGYHHNG